MSLAGDQENNPRDGAAHAEEEATGASGNAPRLSPMSRRRFLLGAASSTALFLAACGRDPTPTPTPGAPQSLLPTPITGNEQYFPIGRNGAFPGAPTPQVVAAAPTSPIDTPAATNTPEPDPTDTPEPEPTATPTPEATPFPPGPPSKLGIFVARNVPEIFDMLETGAVTVVKTLELDTNFAAHIKRVAPNALLIGRIDLPQMNLGSLDPIPEANRFYNQLMAIADNPSRRESFDGWEAYNEPIPANVEEMQRLADFEAERTRLLGEQGIRSVVGNFGVGQPPLEWWTHFFPALQAAKQYNGWLGLHEYSAPTIYYQTTRDGQGRYPDITPQDTGWLTLRYRKVYREHLQPAGLGIPLIFTELGVDGLILDRPGPPDAMGWKDFQGYWAENGFGTWGPGSYIEQLAWYDKAMRQDDYVVGGAIFVMASSDGWQSYDILGPAAGVLQQYMSVHAPQ
jgi:hypothetical protein